MKVEFCRQTFLYSSDEANGFSNRYAIPNAYLRYLLLFAFTYRYILNTLVTGLM